MNCNSSTQNIASEAFCPQSIHKPWQKERGGPFVWRIITLVLCLLANSVTYGKIKGVTMNSQGHWMLQADYCEEIFPQIDVLESLTSDLNHQCGQPQEIEKFLFWGGGCEADVTGCLPPHMRDYQGVKPKIMGPNCWNLSLVVAGILPAHIYTAPDAMTFFMGSPLCRKLENNEERLAGDIGAIRRRWSVEIHGFIYLSENLVYSKNNAYMSPYSLYGLEELYEFFRIDDEPAHCLDNRMEKGCFNGVEFYRCHELVDYFQKHQVDISLELMFGDLAVLEKEVSDIVFSGEVKSSFKRVQQREFRQNVLELVQTLQSNHSESALFMLKMLKLRLTSLVDQLYMVLKPSEYQVQSAELKGLRNIIQETLKKMAEASFELKRVGPK